MLDGRYFDDSQETARPLRGNVPLLGSSAGPSSVGMASGGRPGSALGEQSSESVGLVAPLEPPTSVGRAGIGVPARPASAVAMVRDNDWKSEGRKRRDDVRTVRVEPASNEQQRRCNKRNIVKIWPLYVQTSVTLP